MSQVPIGIGCDEAITTRSGEEEQLDDGVGDTLVSLDATREFAIWTHSCHRTKASPREDLHRPLSEVLCAGNPELDKQDALWSAEVVLTA